jgi:hypothetical protein
MLYHISWYIYFFWLWNILKLDSPLEHILYMYLVEQYHSEQAQSFVGNNNMATVWMKVKQHGVQGQNFHVIIDV